jgi:hypothetical protein
MSFVLPSYSAVDLDVEMIDAGGLQLARLVGHPNGEWKPPPAIYRNLRVDPPAGSKSKYAVLYTGSNLLTSAMECHVLSLSSFGVWTLNEKSEARYHVARYTTGKPGLFIPLDGRNRRTLGLANLPAEELGGYKAHQQVGLSLFTRYGKVAHGLCWESFHRNEPGRVYAIWHSRKKSLGLTLQAGALVVLKADAEWRTGLSEIPDLLRLLG